MNRQPGIEDLLPSINRNTGKECGCVTHNRVLLMELYPKMFLVQNENSKPPPASGKQFSIADMFLRPLFIMTGLCFFGTSNPPTAHYYLPLTHAFAPNFIDQQVNRSRSDH